MPAAAAGAPGTAAASAPGTTSAAYPLWAMIVSLSTKNMNVYDEDSNITSGVNPDVEFKDLLQAEADALDSVTTSDSSSVTDTEWLHAGYHRINWTIKPRLIYSCGSLWDKDRAEWSDSWSADSGPEDKMYLQQNSVADCELMQETDQMS